MLRSTQKKMRLIEQEFISYFQDIRKCEVTINVFLLPFYVNIDTVPAKFLKWR